MRGGAGARALAAGLLLPALWVCNPLRAEGQGPKDLPVQHGPPPDLVDRRDPEGTIAVALDAGPGKDPAGFLPNSQGGDVVLILSSGMFVEPWRARLADFGYRVHMLAGGMPAWCAAGLPEEKPAVTYRSPGTVPFLISKGLCELNEPAHTFD